MRLLIIIPNFEPAWKYGGVMKSAVFLARGLSTLGVNVTVYTMNTADRGELLDVPLETKVSLNGVGVVYFEPSIFSKRDFHSAHLIRHMSKTIGEFDLIYISAMWQYVGVAAAKVAARHNKPFIIAPHGSFAEIKMQSKSLKKKIYFSLFLSQMIRNCSALHFCSEYEKHSFSLPLSKPFMVVPNPVDDFFFEDVLESAYIEEERASGPKMMLAVGRPDRIKRYEYCIQTLAVLRRQNQDVCLTILGPSNSVYGKELKSLAEELGVSDAVNWRPFVTGQELIREFLVADVFISMSRDENFCIAAAEALCLGVPVVCTNTVGIGDFVKEYEMGEVCTADPETAAEAVRSVLASGKAPSAAIRTQARELFQKECVAQAFLDSCKRILSSAKVMSEE